MLLFSQDASCQSALYRRRVLTRSIKRKVSSRSVTRSSRGRPLSPTHWPLTWAESIDNPKLCTLAFKKRTQSVWTHPFLTGGVMAPRSSVLKMVTLPVSFIHTTLDVCNPVFLKWLIQRWIWWETKWNDTITQTGGFYSADCLETSSFKRMTFQSQA